MATKQQIPVLAGVIVSNQQGFKALSDEDTQWAIEHPEEVIRLTVEAVKNRNPPLTVSSSVQTDEAQLSEWQRFYGEVFGDNDIKSINPPMPLTSKGFGWLIVIRKGLTMNEVLKAMRTKFTVYSYIGDDLDKGVPTNDRVADKDYAIRIRDRIEADEELKNRSANWLSKENIVTLTLLERLVLELFYFWKVGPQADLNKVHLDVKNVTLCAGSRCSGGGVPGVYWLSGGRGVGISWYRPGRSNGNLRARAAVVG